MKILGQKFIIVVFLGALAACSTDIKIDAFISNDEAESSYLKALKSKESSNKLGLFFERLNARPSPNFSWDRWWNFLSRQVQPFSAYDDRAWSLVFALQGHFCPMPNPQELESYYSYLRSLKIAKVFKPSSKAYHPLIECGAELPRAKAEQIFLDELNDAPADFSVLNLSVEFVEAEFLNNLSDDNWERLRLSIENSAKDSKRVPDLNRFLRVIAADQDVNIKTMNRLSFAMRSEGTKNTRTTQISNDLSTRSQLEVWMRLLPESVNPRDFAEAWQVVTDLVAQGIRNNELNGLDAFHYHYQIANSFIANEDDFDMPNYLNTFLYYFDRAFLQVYQAFIQEPESLKKFKKSFLAKEDKDLLDIWVWVLLLGAYPNFQEHYLSENSVVQAWVSHRIELRNRMRLRLPQLYPELQNFNQVDWWASDTNVCPIPRVSKKSELVYDREWELIAPEAGALTLNPGCYRLEGDSVFSNLTAGFDTLIRAPSVNFTAEKLQGGVMIDLSGESKAQFVPLLQVYGASEEFVQDGQSLPVIFVETSALDQKRWFVYHFVSQEPRSAALIESDEASLNPKQAADGGNFTNDNPLPEPTWIRSFGAVKTQIFDPIRGAEGAVFIALNPVRDTINLGQFLRDNSILVTPSPMDGRSVQLALERGQFLDEIRTRQFEALDAKLLLKILERYSGVSASIREYLNAQTDNWKSQVFDQMLSELETKESWNDSSFMIDMFSLRPSHRFRREPTAPLIGEPGLDGQDGNLNNLPVHLFRMEAH